MSHFITKKVKYNALNLNATAKHNQIYFLCAHAT